jgi:transposase InsO family protein
MLSPSPLYLLERQFDVGTHEPDQAWVADMTYIPTREGWLYLAVVLDLATRLVVGWSLGQRLDRSLTLNALMMTLSWRRPRPGATLHSDRGSQYASREYRDLLASSGMRESMSRKGDCWDNAVAESVFATLEWELIEDADWRSRAAAGREGDLHDHPRLLQSSAFTRWLTPFGSAARPSRRSGFSHCYILARRGSVNPTCVTAATDR